MEVVRPVVHGRVKTVKTEYSEDELPLDLDFASVLLDWKRQISEETRLTGSELVFTSHVSGRPHHTALAQQDYIRPAGFCLRSVQSAELGSASGAVGRGLHDAVPLEDVVSDSRPVMMGRDGAKEVEGVQVLAFKHSATSHPVTVLGSAGSIQASAERSRFFQDGDVPSSYFAISNQGCRSCEESDAAPPT